MAYKRKASRQIRRGRKMRSRRSMNISGKSALRTTSRRQVYAFKRFVNAKVSINGSDAVNSQGVGISFKLNDIPNSTEFTALFDQYKLAGVAYKWVILHDPNNATVKRFPTFKWVHDYDDDGTPADAATLQQYPAMREFYFSETRQTTRWNFIKPARAAVEYESATLSSYRPQWKGFIDCASNTAPHYGIKAWVDGLQTGVTLVLQCRYYLTFKNVR